jgi:DNA-binding IclR family transcriptional regulator
VSTADKLLAALSLFTLETPEWTVEAAAEALDVSGSTAYRYFNSLCKVGLLDPISAGRYVLGPAIIAYDRQLRLLDPLLQVARPVLNQLVKRNGGEGVGLLCRRFRQQVMCVHQAFEHKPDYAVSYERGRPMGLYRGAASLVILANLPPRTLRRLWAADSANIRAAGLGATWEEVRKSLKGIRAAGVCVTRGQLDKGMIGIAAPIWQAGRQVAGSVSIVMPEVSVSSGEIAGASALVQAAAREIDTSIAELGTRSEGMSMVDRKQLSTAARPSR